jgi:hypothetical protein
MCIRLQWQVAVRDLPLLVEAGRLSEEVWDVAMEKSY